MVDPNNKAWKSIHKTIWDDTESVCIPLDPNTKNIVWFGKEEMLKKDWPWVQPTGDDIYAVFSEPNSSSTPIKTVMLGLNLNFEETA